MAPPGPYRPEVLPQYLELFIDPHDALPLFYPTTTDAVFCITVTSCVRSLEEFLIYKLHLAHGTPVQIPSWQIVWILASFRSADWKFVPKVVNDIYRFDFTVHLRHRRLLSENFRGLPG